MGRILGLMFWGTEYDDRGSMGRILGLKFCGTECDEEVVWDGSDFCFAGFSLVMVDHSLVVGTNNTNIIALLPPPGVL